MPRRPTVSADGRSGVCALLFACAALAGLPGGGSAQLRGTEVRAVRFIGNDTFSRDSLAAAIATSETECRSWVLQFVIPVCPLFGWGERRSELRDRDVTLDVQRLVRWYQIRGFREVRVVSDTDIGPATPPDEDGVRVRWGRSGRPPRREPVEPADEADQEQVASVTFTIDEGRPVLADSIGYVFPEGFDSSDILGNLPIAAGDRWSTLALDATRDSLVRRLRNRGYPQADVLRQTVLPEGEPYHAHVTFEVEPGVSARFGDIRVEGTGRLDRETVLRTLPFESGDPFAADQLFDGQVRLFGLEIIRNARVEIDTASSRAGSVPDSIVPVFVQVTEGDPYRVRAGAGFNESECANTEGRWTSRNFVGGGRVLQLRGRLANIFAPCTNRSGKGEFAQLTWLTAADFTQPWIFSTRNSFRTSLFAERQSVPDVFIRRAVGLQLALSRVVAPATVLTFSYAPELSELEAAEVLFCTGFLACTAEDIGVLSQAQRIAPLGLNVTRDLANSILNPTSGYRLVLDLQHAARWTGSEYRYNRAVAEATWYSRLTPSSIFATRIRGGWVGWGEFYGGDEVIEIIHPQRRFYAGGANSVRGFGQGRLGPRVLAVEEPAGLIAPSVNGVQGAGCTPDELMNLSCDASAIGGRWLDSRPTGGTRVLEGNLEIRFRLSRELELVTFGDVGQVWGTDQTMALADLEFTPGVGMRYLSPVGPIRVDVGYSFRGPEDLSVVTEQIAPYDGDCDVPGSGCLVVPQGGGTEIVIPYVATGELATLAPIRYGGDRGRFELHFSIGQAF